MVMSPVSFLVNKVREYRLLSGVVTREEGNIEKGNTTDVRTFRFSDFPFEEHSYFSLTP